MRHRHLPRSAAQVRALFAMEGETLPARGGVRLVRNESGGELGVPSSTLAALVSLGLVEDGRVTGLGRLALSWLRAEDMPKR